MMVMKSKLQFLLVSNYQVFQMPVIYVNLATKSNLYRIINAKDDLSSPYQIVIKR